MQSIITALLNCRWSLIRRATVRALIKHDPDWVSEAWIKKVERSNKTGW